MRFKDKEASINYRDPALSADAASRAARRKDIRIGATKATEGHAGLAEGESYRAALKRSRGE